MIVKRNFPQKGTVNTPPRGADFKQCILKCMIPGQVVTGSACLETNAKNVFDSD